ncbi:PC-esterase domain-containing protein 1A-like [Heteronotia binoei]|uniref:PC-esterase domain-containing protein 1A-like n=1 Tax=Heteronotia binoei TaxID=13085 RepID=UPI002931A261|nr:PC-esterase domain-containing protein 1A-like [Heteronotia binoei]
MEKRPLGDLYDFSSEHVQKLLHNKFVVILGDSIQRTIYKDLVRFLQDNGLLTEQELKVKGEETFWNDRLIEWFLTRETTFREVRQYRSDHHLLRFYFITRIFSEYVESILADFKAGPVPDLLILNSCVWDLNRYADWSSKEPLEKAFWEYRQNLQTLFEKLHDILPTSCLIIWNTAMPISRKVRKTPNLATPEDILRANFEGATLSSCFQFDVMDLNFCFRFFEECRAWDGVHWNAVVHRFITKLLLTHVARDWGVKLKQKQPSDGIVWRGNAAQHRGPQRQPLMARPPPPPRHLSSQATYANGLPFAPLIPRHDPNFQPDSIPSSGNSPGYFNFEDDWEPPAYPEEMQYGSFSGPADYVPDGGPAIPRPFPIGPVPDGGWHFSLPSHVDYVPDGGQQFPPRLPCRSPQGFRGGPHNGLTMRHQHFYGEPYRPYFHRSNGARNHPRFQVPPYVGPRGW